MYYNIKIKMNDSEFSLESSDKAVTQREMDVYFACFFDASPEFRSKIKKVEIRDENLVSIDDKLEEKIFKSAPVPRSLNEASSNNSAFLDNSNSLQASDENDDSDAIDLSDIYEQNLDIDSSELAQSEDFDSEPDELDFEVEDLPDEDSSEDDNQNTRPQRPINTELDSLGIGSNVNLHESLINEALVETNKSAQASVQEEQKNITFQIFLAGFVISELKNQFLACAFYIKNVLHESSFTIKSINSKIYKATGSIADMAIISKLIDEKYIAMISDEGIKQYSITELGEEYFVRKYQD